MTEAETLRYEDRFSEAASSEIRHAPQAPHVDTDFVLDGKQGRVIAKLPENGDDGYRAAVDDSVDALEDAIANPKCLGCDSSECADCNATGAALLQKDNHIAISGGGSSGRRIKQEKPASMVDRREAQRARMAGHDETRMGRPLKGAERRENFSTSIDPATRRVLRASEISIADVLDEIADLPEVRALDGVGTAQGDDNATE